MKENNDLLFLTVLQSGLSSARWFFCSTWYLLGLKCPRELFHSHFQHFSWNGWTSGGSLGSLVSPSEKPDLFCKDPSHSVLGVLTQDLKTTNSSIQILIKPLLMSCLLMSHCPKQVIWPILELICEGLQKSMKIGCCVSFTGGYWCISVPQLG